MSDLGAANGKRRVVMPLALWLAALAVIFLTLPFGLYRLLEAADADKRELLLDGVRDRGRLAMEVLRPVLSETADRGLIEAPAVIKTVAADDNVLRLFFRPAHNSASAGFYYVAAAPARSSDELERERQSLQGLGVFAHLSAACGDGRAVVGRRRLVETEEEVVTAVTPLLTADGCWALLTALSTAAYQNSSIGRPYWETPEIRFGAIAYVGSLVVAAMIVWLIWRGLRQLMERARAIRLAGGGSGGFADDIGPREFVEVGRELDRLVSALDRSAQLIREVAVENAHAFKRPVAIIRQSIEPVRRRADDARLARAVEVIDQALDRLESLITAAWRVDDLVASLIHPRREVIDVSARLREIAAAYGKMSAGSGANFSADIAPDISSRAAAELIDGIVENLLDNALSFTPAGGAIFLRLRRDAARIEIVVSDTGCGVPEISLPKIFDRYYTKRTGTSDREEIGHLGLGLWLVRRNAEALGGSVAARNRPTGGLEVSVKFPIIDGNG